MTASPGLHPPVSLSVSLLSARALGFGGLQGTKNQLKITLSTEESLLGDLEQSGPQILRLPRICYLP
jgi:hypothetical protein